MSQPNALAHRPGTASVALRLCTAALLLAFIALAAWASLNRSASSKPAASANAALPSGDWPVWRADAGHTAATPHALPAALDLQWSLDLGRPEPAWPFSQDKIQFDAAPEPVVLGGTIFVPSTRSDSVTAYDIATGAKRWEFFAEGPVRLAPAAADGKVYFGSDDGCLYCLDAATGKLAWKHRAVPSGHKTLGNERLVSTWPVRGGPVLHDGTVYCAAGIWPSMGIYLCALDAATGNVRWVNSGDGMAWQDQPHAPSAKAFAGIAPQGCLAVAGDRLIVPSGRAVPGAFDLATGRFLYSNFAEHAFGKDVGGHAVAVLGDRFFCGPGHNRPAELGNTPGMYALADGKPLVKTRATVFTTQAIYQAAEGAVQALDPRNFKPKDKKLTELWSLQIPGVTEVFCKAGDRLYAGGQGRIAAIDTQTTTATLAWEKEIPGTPAVMLAARGRLFVSTLEGTLYCFGSGGKEAPAPAVAASTPRWPAEDEVTPQARQILDATGERDGYCLVLMSDSTGRLMEELARQSNLRVIGLTPDATHAGELRARWASLGIPFSRLSVIEDSITSAQCPPYLANLIIQGARTSSSASASDPQSIIAKTFHSLRPYGGKAVFPADLKPALERAAAEAKLAGAAIRTAGDYAILERSGPLPGAGSWTHNYSDPANSVFSTDSLVKAPLGVLWYGGSDHLNVLPRHGHGPTELVVGGRLFIQGPDHLTARDVYTGRTLWERELPALGAFFDNTSHESGANHVGSNYAAATDAVYVAYGKQGLRLDPATGNTITTFTLKSPAGDPLDFSLFRITGDLMVVAAGPRNYNDARPGVSKNWNHSGSRHLFVMNRATGQILWQREADNLFHHNSIIVGGDTVYAIDRIAPGLEKERARRGDVELPFTLLALDLRTGQEKWKTDQEVFGTWLGYSQECQVLIQSGRPSKDMVLGEPGQRIIAYQPATGDVLWDRKANIIDGPYVLYHGMLIMQDSSGGYGVELRTGRDVMRLHPITGLPVRWRFQRRHGCNTALASENLLTFRSGALGFYDMKTLGGTSNFGGVKTGCTPCLISADGVLSAPDYTRTCICAYQNQCSLALVHMPEMEMWAYGGWAAPATTHTLRRVGLNFGATGDRATPAGTVWLDYPSVGFESPDPRITVEPESTTYFRQHSLLAASGPDAWITASGALGVRKVSLVLRNPAPRPCTVRLYFAEPEGAAPGKRVFNVTLQGKTVLSGFDIAREAGSGGRGLVREFKGVMAGESLDLALDPAPGSPLQAPVLCGLELVAE